MFWERGSLLATAITPIIVALVSEVLNRPAKVITPAAPRVTRRSGDRRRGARRAADRRRRARRGPGAGQPLGRRGRPVRPARRRSAPRAAASRCKLAVVTGLLAAVIGAGVVTASELAVFGHSVGDSDRSTERVRRQREHGARRRRPRRRRPTATATATETADARRRRDDAARRRRPRRRRDGHRDAGHADRRRHADRRPAGTPTADALVAKDKIPTSRIARTARVSSLAAGQAARHLGTRATNLGALRGGQAAPRSSAATSRPPSRSSPRSGR